MATEAMIEASGTNDKAGIFEPKARIGVGGPPMLISEQCDKIIPAFVKAQAKIGRATRYSEAAATEKRKYMYADLASCMDACGEPLAENGFAVTHSSKAVTGGVEITTCLLHESGQWMANMVRITCPDTAHGVGSAMTYGRRYGLCLLVGIVPDDDDGAGAMARTEPRRYDRSADYNQDAPPATGTPHERGQRHNSMDCAICKALGVPPGVDVVQRRPDDHLWRYDIQGHEPQTAAQYCPICQEIMRKRNETANGGTIGSTSHPAPAATPGPKKLKDRIGEMIVKSGVTEAQMVAFLCHVLNSPTVAEAIPEFRATAADAMELFLVNDGPAALKNLILTIKDDKAELDLKMKFSICWQESAKSHPLAAAEPAPPAQATSPALAPAQIEDDEAEDPILGLHVITSEVMKAEKVDDGGSMLLQCAITGPDGVKNAIAGFPFKVPLGTEHAAWYGYFLKKFDYPKELLEMVPPKIKLKTNVKGLKGKMLVEITRNVKGDGYLVSAKGFDHIDGKELEDKLAKAEK